MFFPLVNAHFNIIWLNIMWAIVEMRKNRPLYNTKVKINSDTNTIIP